MKTVLVTGAAKRFGRTMAVALCQRGLHVIAHYNSSEQDALALQSEMLGSGLRMDLFQWDLRHVTDTQASANFWSKVVEAYGQCFAFINNASIFEYDTPSSIDADVLERSLHINLKAPMLLMDSFLSHSARVDPAQTPIVINMLDAKVRKLNPDYLSYTLGKVGLAAATSMYAMHYAGAAKIYGVAPSMFLESGEITRGRVEELTKVNLLNRPVTAVDICDTVEFLLQGVAATGEIVLHDAGQTLLNLTRDVAFAR